MSVNQQLMSLLRDKLAVQGGAGRRRKRKATRKRGGALIVGGARKRLTDKGSRDIVWINEALKDSEFSNVGNVYDDEYTGQSRQLLRAKPKVPLKRTMVYDDQLGQYVTMYRDAMDDYFEPGLIDNRYRIPKKRGIPESLVRRALKSFADMSGSKVMKPGPEIVAKKEGVVNHGFGRRRRRRGRGGALTGGLSPYQRHMKKAMGAGYNMADAAAMWSGGKAPKRRRRRGRGGMGISGADLITQILSMA